MRVKLILDLVNRLSPGAKAAARDLKGIRDTTKGLAGQRGPEKVARDIERLSPASRQAARNLREVKIAARETASARGPEKLARDLERTRAAAARTARELRATKAAMRDWARGTALGEMSAASGKVGAAALSGGGMLAAGRGALLPLAAAYGGYRGVSAGVRGTVGQSVSFETAMADVIKKVDIPAGQTSADLEKMITSSAIRFGRSREEIAGLTAELGAAGVAYQDLGRSIALATKASVSWDIIPSETGEKLAKIRTQHNLSLDQLEEFGDKVNALADSGASKERSIVEMFQRAAAGAKAADVGQDTSLAFMTAMNAGGMQDEIAARGFGAMVSKLRTAASVGNKKMAAGLKTLGLTPAGVEKGMKTDSLKTMLDLMDRFAASNDKAAVAVKMFGQEWWDEFARMVQSAPEIAKNLRLLNDPKQWQGSMNKTLNIELATTDNHLKRLKALASDVGDRLGRWALPPLNEAIDRIINGMDSLDARATEKEREKEIRAAEDATSQKLADEQPLTPEERERLARDGAYRRRVQGAAQDKRTDKGNVSLNDGLRLAELERERGQMAASIEARRKAGATNEQLAYSISRLDALHDQIRAIDPTKAPTKSSTDPRRPADAEERGRADRGDALALRERLNQLENRLAAIDALRRDARTPADREGYDADAAAVRGRRDRTLLPGGRFGFGPGGAPISAKAGATGPGLSSFGAVTGAGAAWANGLRNAFDIDLGPAGMTMMERLTAGIRSGGAGAESAAAGVKGGVEGAFAGSDLSGAGASMMTSLAAGIRAGGAQAVAEAQRVAQQVKAATAGAAAGGARPRAIAGALHDGVD